MQPALGVWYASSMRLHIPKCGDAAKLVSSWTFELQPEYRNEAFYNTWNGTLRADWQPEKRGITLEAGTELVFDRVYIRQHADEFASVTFIIKEAFFAKLVGERFWVKLEDANRLELDYTSSDNPVGGLAKRTYKAVLKERSDPSLVGKREAAGVAKMALEFARDHVRKECGGMSIDRHRQHVDDIISAVCSGPRGARWQTMAPDRGTVRMYMTNKPRRRADTDMWSVRSTSVPDGTTVRELRFTWNGMKFGGFKMTMHGNKVLTCEALV